MMQINIYERNFIKFIVKCLIKCFNINRYMFFVKTMCGDESEMILEEVLMSGYITASEVITKTYKKIEQSPCM